MKNKYLKKIILTGLVMHIAYAYSAHCPDRHFCLTLHTPIQTDASNEAYDLIVTSIMTLEEGDRAIDRTDLTISAGEYFYDFKDQPFRTIYMSIDKIRYQPGNNESSDNYITPKNCQKTFIYTPGNHLINLTKNRYDATYQCD